MGNMVQLCLKKRYFLTYLNFKRVERSFFPFVDRTLLIESATSTVITFAKSNRCQTKSETLPSFINARLKTVFGDVDSFEFFSTKRY